MEDMRGGGGGGEGGWVKVSAIMHIKLRMYTVKGRHVTRGWQNEWCAQTVFLWARDCTNTPYL